MLSGHHFPKKNFVLRSQLIFLLSHDHTTLIMQCSAVQLKSSFKRSRGLHFLGQVLFVQHIRKWNHNF
jgi:hypothetical protein